MSILNCSAIVLYTLLLAICCADAQAQAGSIVKVSESGGAYRLEMNGNAYFIKGAGGDGSKTLLHELGGNSFRTWGSDNAGSQLDEAQKLGMMVTLGVWLGHKEHGFDYSNADQVADQQEMVRKTVLKYKSHPALLMWALGNEMEGDGNNAAVWSAIQNLAAMVKKLDPNHPIMTVIAEIGGSKVKNINRICPDIDIIGINSYGGGASLAKRYTEAGGVKPYVVTEFGPPGVWEIGKNGLGAVEELTSTAKAEAYAGTYRNSIAGNPLCLGSYAFAWGNKQEATATWFGLMLPDGSRLGATDALSLAWSGHAPAYACPTLRSLKADRYDVDPGTVINATLDAASAGGDPLKVNWVLQSDVQNVNTNGATELAPPTHADAIIHADNSSVRLKMPDRGGIYRLFAYVHDTHGGAAVANIPLLVKGGTAAADTAVMPAKRAALPFVVYDEADHHTSPWIASGYMGNAGAIKMDDGCTTSPHAGKTCIKVQYTARDNWGGVVWQDPANDWGDQPGGVNLVGASRLTFWARGDAGGEKVTFICGLIKSDKPYHDSALTHLPDVILTPSWKQYTIGLKGKDLSRVKTGFAWTLAATGSPVTFYLDDIRFE